jgi:hypothetical protein
MQPPEPSRLHRRLKAKLVYSCQDGNASAHITLAYTMLLVTVLGSSRTYGVSLWH